MSLNIAPLFGDAVNIGRFEAHHAMAIGADVPHADVITHDDEDVGFLLLLCRCWRTHHDYGSEQCQRSKPDFSERIHHLTPYWRPKAGRRTVPSSITGAALYAGRGRSAAKALAEPRAVMARPANRIRTFSIYLSLIRIFDRCSLCRWPIGANPCQTDPRHAVGRSRAANDGGGTYNPPKR